MVRCHVPAAETITAMAAERNVTAAVIVDELLTRRPAPVFTPASKDDPPTHRQIVGAAQAAAFAASRPARCSCPKPTLSRVVSNLCTACGLLR